MACPPIERERDRGEEKEKAIQEKFRWYDMHVIRVACCKLLQNCALTLKSKGKVVFRNTQHQEQNCA